MHLHLSEKNMKQNRRWLFLGLAILIFLLGIGVFIYPIISNLVEEHLQSNVIHGYETSVKSLQKEEQETERKKAEEYNQKLRFDYENILNLEKNGVMGYIEIPTIDVELPIYHGSEEESLKKGVGHIRRTSLPIGGEGTHSILTGHRGLPNAELFTRLDELGEKDCFYLHVLDQILAYEIDQITTVLPEEIDHIENEPNEDYVTLVTCTPYGVNSHRLLVRGSRIPYEPEEKTDMTESFWDKSKKFVWLGAGAGVSIASVGYRIYLQKKRKRKYYRYKKK